MPSPPLFVTFRLYGSLPAYDHLIRNDDEFWRIQRYIETNPVTACLAARPEDYAWSSGRRPVRPTIDSPCSGRVHELGRSTFKGTCRVGGARWTALENAKAAHELLSARDSEI